MRTHHREGSSATIRERFKLTLYGETAFQEFQARQILTQHITYTLTMCVPYVANGVDMLKKTHVLKMPCFGHTTPKIRLSGHTGSPFTFGTTKHTLRHSMCCPLVGTCFSCMLRTHTVLKELLQRHVDSLELRLIISYGCLCSDMRSLRIRVHTCKKNCGLPSTSFTIIVLINCHDLSRLLLCGVIVAPLSTTHEQCFSYDVPCRCSKVG